MKIPITIEVYFDTSGRCDLFSYTQLGADEGFSENLKFEEILKDSFKGLTAEEKRKAKIRIANRLRKFLHKLER